MRTDDPLFGAAILKLSFIQKGMTDNPGFRAVYHGTIKDLGVTDQQVTDYIEAHRAELENHLQKGRHPKD